MDRDYRPPYIQAADVLRAAITSGELSPGQKLPSARELQQRFDIASSTVQNALRLLKEEGLIYSVQGRGSYVSSPPGAGTEQILIQPTPAGGAVSVGLPPASTDHQAPATPPDSRPPVSAEDSRAPYLQVADALRRQIRDNQLPSGAKLPSARELQEQFGIANSTVQNALRELKAEGLIYSVQGRGVFVGSVYNPADLPRSPAASGLGRGFMINAAEQKWIQDAEQEALQHQTTSDEDLLAEAEHVQQRVERLRGPYEAALIDLEALSIEINRRNRIRQSLRGPEDAAIAIRRFRDWLNPRGKRDR